MNPISLMADAGKLSIGQLQQAVRNGTVPAYIGIPMMQEKMKEAKQAQTPQAPSEPPIAQQVMAQASGIDQVPSNLPTQAMNDGGIVAFANGGSNTTSFGDDEDDDYEEYQLAQDEAEHQNSMAMHQQMAESGGFGGLKTPVNRTPPVEGGITSGKNYDEHQFVRGVGNGHKGIDYAMPVGTPISPKVEGTLRYNTRDPKGWGNAAEIVDDNGRVLQRFAHLSRFEAPEGTRVKPGQVIAMSGNTGRSTGPHLHVENFHADGGITRLAGGGIASFSGTKGSLITNSSTPYNSAPKDEEELKTENNVFDIITPMQRRLQAAKDQAAADAAARGQPIQEHNFNESIDSSLAGNFKPSPLIPAGAKGHGMADYQPGLAAFPDMISNDGMYGGTPPSKDFSFAKPVVEPNGGSPELSRPSGNKETTSAGGNGTKENSDYKDFMDYFKKGHEDLKAQREEDKYMAILQAGLGMMAGTSPNALANIGQGASAGIANYGASAKQRAAEKNALLKGEITARRYQEMGEDRRSAQRIAEGRYKDALDYRGEKDKNELDEKESARLARTESAISKQIDTREKAIEAMVNKEYDNIVLKSQPNAEAKKAARIAQLKAEDSVLKRHHKSLSTIYPKIFGFDYEAPNYGASTTTKREYFDVNGKPVK